MSKAAMIWSAILRLSDERTGDSGLIRKTVSHPDSERFKGFSYSWLFLEHAETRIIGLFSDSETPKVRHENYDKVFFSIFNTEHQFSSK